MHRIVTNTHRHTHKNTLEITQTQNPARHRHTLIQSTSPPPNHKGLWVVKRDNHILSKSVFPNITRTTTQIHAHTSTHMQKRVRACSSSMTYIEIHEKRSNITSVIWTSLCAVVICFTENNVYACKHLFVCVCVCAPVHTCLTLGDPGRVM